MSKPQRRKGNAKAASSASAAALLERSGYSTSFVGFGSGATNVFEVAAAAKAGVACKELDPDVVLILRKLSKKDPQTREKALRELLVCLKEKDREMLEICYNHFATLMDKLIVDGSPTVRMLSLRVTSFFISSLKKAAEKQLRVIMPMVLIATCDTSLSVSNQAEAVLSENFPGEKASQAESIFAADTANLAIDIIAGRHALVQSQKYDCEDSPEQRVSRLTVQCLLVIARLAQSASNNTQFKEVLESFFKQTAVIKNLTKGIPAVKSALLGICLKASDCVPLLLDTPLASWIISNLDSADSSICTKAFEAFTVLLSDERFYSKFDVQKSVVPKLLSVVRRKEVHWRHASKFFLPSYAVLVPHVNDQAKFIKSFLESFIDNLPFEIGGSMSFWAESFAECVKFTYSNKETVAETTDLNIVEVLLQSVELVREESSDCQEIITSLLLWLLERNVLSPENTTFLLDSLQLNLMNKRPQSDTTCALLVASASWPLREFHCALLRVPPLHPDFVKPLLTCSDEYLEHIDKGVNLLSALSRESKPSPVSAQVVLRILRRNPDKMKELNLLSSSITPLILTEFSSTDWPMISSSLGEELIPCLKKIIAQWENERNYTAISKVLGMIEVAQRGQALSGLLDDSCSIQFISELLRTLELPEDLTAECSRISFHSLFNNDVSDEEIDSVLQTLSRFPPCEILIRNALLSYLNESLSSKPYSLASLNRIGLVCSQLLYSDSRYRALLPSQDELLTMLTDFDTYVTNDVLAKYGLFGEPFQDGKEPPGPEEHLLTSIEKSARRALIYLSIDCEDKAHDVSLAYAAAVFPIAQMFYDTRWRCDVIPEVISDAINRWHQVFQKTALASSRAISALMALPSSPATAQMALHHLRYSTHSRLPLQSWNEPEKKVAWFWALHCDCSELKLGSLEQWITRFHFESEFNFLSRIYEHIQSDASEWEDSIFNASSLGSPSWRISALCLLAALNHLDEVTLPSLPPELLDFIMCGAVTALDSCDERMDTKCENPAQLESLAGLALMLFSECDKLSCHNYGNSFDTEWPNFFLPTMARIIVRWFTFLRADSRPTFFVRSLVDALLRIKQLPDDLSLQTKLCPELDKFGYDPIHQTLIIHAEDLLPSDSVFIRFTALHMLRILSPVMYKQENGQWMEEEKVSSTGPRHLVIPDTLARMIDTATGWPSIMAFDAALMPLSSCIFSDEERVAYCDALLHSVSTILPQILARCPENIPKSKESEYFTSPSLEFNTEIYSRYAANLLYRALGSLPAVVRNWYAGLPNTGMQIVSKYIRRYVSKLLVDAELNKVKVANQKQLKTDKLLKIRVVPVSGEVVAEYTVEETTMRLSIVMPSDWPLSVPTIQIDKAIVPSEKVKKWLLQLTAYLFHQNGSTVEGVMMWRKNVDRDVEGAEACTICMMTIHSTNHQLPKVKCRQCKNKFHSNCLYKWFESSSQTSCPLCRSNFG
nr:Zinc finger domain containing protein [Haemonchus contortus]